MFIRCVAETTSFEQGCYITWEASTTCESSREFLLPIISPSLHLRCLLHLWWALSDAVTPLSRETFVHAFLSARLAPSPGDCPDAPRGVGLPSEADDLPERRERASREGAAGNARASQRSRGRGAGGGQNVVIHIISEVRTRGSLEIARMLHLCTLFVRITSILRCRDSLPASTLIGWKSIASHVHFLGCSTLPSSPPPCTRKIQGYGGQDALVCGGRGH